MGSSTTATSPRRSLKPHFHVTDFLQPQWRTPARASRSNRDLAAVRELDPLLQDFATWLTAHHEQLRAALGT
ncbi:hypothetical protein [Streptomyces sp. FH025]|uniref:hypothetical protein n=1 Tax=Streptomyces sp. FH025 TaxID=2815937 RepID=UPI001A9FD61B|nr:hypothetical protein [Streptomyces sp. FH025]MBO1419167.1 hypothetical protein [Streptomyces sp. FH025]